MVYFFNIWFGIVQHRKQLGSREGRKFDLNIPIFTELKKIASRINSNCSNFSSLFFKSIKFSCCSFSLIKKQFTVAVQVCCLFYFLLHSTFFKGKVKSGIFGGFYCFSLLGLLKKGLIYFGWVQLREGSYGRLIDFLSQISKLSNFNLLD